MTLPGIGQPRFSADEAARIAQEHFTLRARARPLPSERDQNFLLETDDGQRCVLKIANAHEDPAFLDLQNQVLERLHAALEEPACPRPLPTPQGDLIVPVAGPDGQLHRARLLTYLPGRPLADYRPHTPGLMARLGALMARIDLALQGLDHPAARRRFHWDLALAHETLADCLPEVRRAGERALLDGFLERWERHVRPRWPGLRRQLVHNDANDYNVVVHHPAVDQEPALGLLDFGDMVETALVAEVAVAAAYAILDKPDPLRVACQVVRGYHAYLPLTDEELALLYDAIAMRLCLSLGLAARQRRLDPANEYLDISQDAVRRTLPTWQALHPRLAEAAFRAACGLEPDPRAAGVVAYLRKERGGFAPLVPFEEARPIVLDLSVGSPTIDRPALEDGRALAERIALRLPRDGAALGVGRYAEVRPWEAAGPTAADPPPRRRTLHLGLDLFLPPGTPVRAPLAGEVHDLGPPDGPETTLVLAHHPPQAPPFYSLYRGLDPASLAGLSPGDRLRPGDRLGTVARREGPSRLHVQVLVDDFGLGAAFPGMADPEERALWLGLCPDPNLLLGLEGVEPARPVDKARTLARRRALFSGALSLSYREPLEILRGAGAFLYDEQGRAYLDAVNNVCHVGHCHPAVVRAAADQMAVLNTNTRYLHELRVAYAERLLATLPEPLRVVFLVNSGSEANDLALRLATAHTGARDILVLDGAYHGNLSSLIAISPYKFNGPGGEGPPDHVHVAPTPDGYRGPYKNGDPEAGARYAAEVARLIEQLRARGRKPAAFIAEPLMGVAGQIVPPPGFLPAAFQAVREAGGVCIADEVQIGFGRLGSHFWGFEFHSAIPDIVTMGKPIGNGHPLAAVVTTPEVAASFLTGMEYFNTFGGNPVSCAVGLAMLEVIEAEGLQARALEVGEHLKAGLAELQQRHPLIGDVRGQGLFLGVELVRDRETLEPAEREAYYIIERMKDLGVLLSVDGPLHNVLKIKPPLVFSRAHADRLLEALDEVLSDTVLRR